ncbi:MAG: hypothetical protein ACI4AB_10770 [Acetatifactor sp.]
MEEKGKNIFVKISEKIAFGIAGLFILYLFLLSIFSTCFMWFDTEEVFYVSDVPILMMLGLVVLVPVVYAARNIIKRMVNARFFQQICTVIWFFLLLGFVVNTKVSPVYDQAQMYNGTIAFINGDYSMWQRGGYFALYPFNNGPEIIYILLAGLFPENLYWAVQGLHMIIYFFMAVGMKKLANLFFGESVSRIVYAGILFFIPLWGYVKYMYGNLPGLAFGIWASFFAGRYLADRRRRDMGLTLLCIFGATAMKSNLLIIAVSMSIILIVRSIELKTWRLLVPAVLVPLVAFAGIKGPAWVMGTVTGGEMNNGIPTLNWIMMGLKEGPAPGWFNGDPVVEFEQTGYSAEVSSEIAWNSIQLSVRNFAENPEYAVSFFGRKLASIWNNPTFEGFQVVLKGNVAGTLDYWMKDILYNGGIANTIFTLLLNIVQSIFLFGIILFLIFCREDKKLSKAIPLVSFIGAFLLHIFWEAKCQYTILFFVPLLPYALRGYQGICNEIENWKKEGKGLKNITGNSYFRKSVALLLLVAILLFLDNPVVNSTVKLGGDGGEYIWICQERAFWKSDTFTKEGEHQW